MQFHVDYLEMNDILNCIPLVFFSEKWIESLVELCWNGNVAISIGSIWKNGHVETGFGVSLLGKWIPVIFELSMVKLISCEVDSIIDGFEESNWVDTPPITFDSSTLHAIGEVSFISIGIKEDGDENSISFFFFDRDLLSIKYFKNTVVDAEQV